MLAGVLAPDSGSITLEGIDVVADPERARPWLSYMPQRFGLYEDLTVDENIFFYATLFGVTRAARRERGQELLEAAGMLPFRRRLAGKLSGGMKQKLGLVCALIHTPKVLLLDEPTTGVDPVSRRDFWGILVRVAQKHGVTIVLSTAYMDEAERCSRLALVSAGEIRHCDTPARLKQAMPGALLEVATANARAAYTALEGAPGVARPAAHGRPRPRIAGRRRGGPVVRIAGLAGGQGHRGRYRRAHRTGNRGRVRRVAQSGRRRMTDAVVAEGLTKTFGAFTAVDHLDLSIAKGEVVGFIGPNGAGKSTTIRMLCGLLRPSAGRAEVAGYDVGREPEAVREHIGYMSQKFSLYGDLSVQEKTCASSAGFTGSIDMRSRRGRMTPSPWRDWWAAWTHWCGRSPADGSSGWRLVARFCTGRRCCSSMNRRQGSSRKRAAASGN